MSGVRPNRAMRIRKVKRERTLTLTLSEEEHEAIATAAFGSDEYPAVWARDVLLTRAMGLFRQRNLIEEAA